MTPSLPRSAYVHIPFCRHRCGYCNFSLVAGRDPLIDRFLHSLELEFQLRFTETRASENPIPLDTLFFGGGTPSHLNEEQLSRLGALMARYFQLATGAEVTAECNPSDIDDAKVAALASLGVNRISLGAQSMNNDKLKRLERDHSGDQVRRAVEIARRRIDNISLDLIFAAPSETLDFWKQDLHAAMSLQPQHFSTYELTFEKGTQFWNRLQRGSLSVSEEDLRADMYEFAIGSLENAGWQQYELSSFAKPGYACRHNQIYWSGEPYFAFGPGASRFINGVRETNHSSTMQYMKLLENGSSPTAHVEKLDGLESSREQLVVGLRRRVGVSLQAFHQRTGNTVEEALGSVAAELIEHGLIVIEDDHCRLTQRGIMVSDGIASRILSQ